MPFYEILETITEIFIQEQDDARVKQIQAQIDRLNVEVKNIQVKIDAKQKKIDAKQKEIDVEQEQLLLLRKSKKSKDDQIERLQKQKPNDSPKSTAPSPAVTPTPSTL